MKTNVYVDGFNLYYGCLRGSQCKWVDLAAFSHRLVPKHQVHRIRYFIARVHNTPADPHVANRQQTFIRALRTIPNLSIHFGHFLSHPVWMPLAHPPSSGPRTVQVIRTEEKGSDVNLATFLLFDGFEGDYEQAVVISNDSDLAEPIRLVQSKLNLPVGVFNPHRNTSATLRRVATFYRRVRPGALKASQFPPVLTDANGTFGKPVSW